MRVIFFFVFIALNLNAKTYAQNGEELDRRNGFKDIKLLSNINDNAKLEFSRNVRDKPDYAIYKPRKGQYDKIGDINIKKLNVYVYRKQIYQIEITTDKSMQLFKSLEKAFGKINTSMVSKNAFWEGEKVRLNYLVEGSNKLILRYRSRDIDKIIAIDDKKKIDSLSTEF